MYNFPDSPVPGQTATAPNGATFIWDGVKWGAITTPAQSPEEFLPITGGTLSGPLILDADPTNPLGAVTRQYVDSHGITGGPYLSLAGGTMTGALTLAADPAQPLQAATRNYVDNLTVDGGNF